MSDNPKEVAEGFFSQSPSPLYSGLNANMPTESYLAFPVMIFFYAAGYAWKRTTPQRAHEINLDVSIHMRASSRSLLTNHFSLAVRAGSPSRKCVPTALNGLTLLSTNESTASSSPTKAVAWCYFTTSSSYQRTPMFHFSPAHFANVQHLHRMISTLPCDTPLVLLYLCGLRLHARMHHPDGQFSRRFYEGNCVYRTT